MNPTKFLQAVRIGEFGFRGVVGVEIDLTQQHVWVYRGGEVAVSTDCVTGKAISGNNTPNGIFAIQFKQRDVLFPLYPWHL